MGAEAAKRGWLNDAAEALAIDSHVGIMGLGFLEVGDEMGGVTGALFDILKGGRHMLGNTARPYGKRFDALLFASIRDGLGNEEEEGLTW